MTIDPSVFVQMGFREFSYTAKFSPEIKFCIDRDPARFNMSPKDVQRRRTLFWEVFGADLFHVGDIFYTFTFASFDKLARVLLWVVLPRTGCRT
jgi:hypothetical protein